MFSICRVKHRTKIHIHNGRNAIPFEQWTISINETIFSELVIARRIKMNSAKYPHNHRNGWRFDWAVHPSADKSFESISIYYEKEKFDREIDVKRKSKNHWIRVRMTFEEM